MRPPRSPTPILAASLLVGLAGAGGCLVPIPLEQEAATDGGQVMMVTGANPSFGTYTAMTSLEQFNLSVDVVSDSPTVTGRLYLQVNGSCCNLNIDDPKVTRYLQHADATPVGSGTGRYTIDFREPVLPCTMVFSGNAYIVPVLASEGFLDGPTMFRPDGLGIVDRSHYWTVTCP